MYFSLLAMNIAIIMHVTTVSLRVKKRQCRFCYTDSLLSIFFYVLICCLAVVTEIHFLYTKEFKDCILALLLLFQYFLIFSKSYAFIGDDCIYMDGQFFSIDEQIEGQMVKKNIWFGRKLYMINAERKYAGIYVTSKKLKYIWRDETTVIKEKTSKNPTEC